MPHLHQKYRHDLLGEIAVHVSHDSLAGAFAGKTTVTSADADPSTNYAGIECRTSTHVLVSIQALTAVTGWAGKFWIMPSASEEWLPTEVFAGMSTASAHTFFVAGAKRCFFQITALSGTSLDVSYKRL